MTIEIILTIVGTLGLGTVIGAYFQSNFQHYYENYLNTVSSMRKDLWGKNTKISSKNLEFVTDPHASK